MNELFLRFRNKFWLAEMDRVQYFISQCFLQIVGIILFLMFGIVTNINFDVNNVFYDNFAFAPITTSLLFLCYLIIIFISFVLDVERINSIKFGVNHNSAIGLSLFFALVDIISFTGVVRTLIEIGSFAWFVYLSCKRRHF